MGDFVVSDKKSENALPMVSFNESVAQSPPVRHVVEPIQFVFRDISVQPKLKVSQPGDTDELEADQVAEKIASMYPTSQVGANDDPASSHCKDCKTETNLRRKANSREKVSGGTKDIICNRVNGFPLDPSTRQFMESGFGFDFGNVRIHADKRAAESALSINALAYTIGQDIVFGADQYQPAIVEGRKLLAHELVHVVQQNGSSERLVQRAVVSAARPIVNTQQLTNFRALITQYRQIRASGSLTAEEIAEVDRSIAQAEQAIRTAEDVSESGSSLYAASAMALGATAVLAADDATVIGIADDVALPFTLLAAGALAAIGWTIGSSAQEIRQASDAAGRAVSEAINTIGQIILAQAVGEQIRGNTRQIIAHLARILGTTVAGRPPDHQQDPNRNRGHWWTEIKAFLKNIQSRGLSPKQLMRELRKAFTEEQIAEIREVLRRVAEMMGEGPTNFPPTLAP